MLSLVLFQVAELQVKLKTSADNMEEQQQLLSTEVRTCLDESS